MRICTPPQTSSNWSGDTTTGRVMTMIDRALAEQNVDGNRLYVTGLSNGGGGTWNMLSRYDGRFAAAVPICGVSPAGDFAPSRLIDDSIVAFHARDDNIVSVSTTRTALNRILDAASEARPTYPSSSDPPVFTFASQQMDLYYFELATGGHGIWPGVYSFPPLYDWMFAHSLAVPEPSMIALTTVLGLCSATLNNRLRHSHHQAD